MSGSKIYSQFIFGLVNSFPSQFGRAGTGTGERGALGRNRIPITKITEKWCRAAKEILAADPGWWSYGACCRKPVAMWIHLMETWWHHLMHRCHHAVTSPVSGYSGQVDKWAVWVTMATGLSGCHAHNVTNGSCALSHIFLNEHMNGRRTSRLWSGLESFYALSSFSFTMKLGHRWNPSNHHKLNLPFSLKEQAGSSKLFKALRWLWNL